MLSANFVWLSAVFSVAGQISAHKYQGLGISPLRCDRHAVNETKSHLARGQVPERNIRFIVTTMAPFVIYDGDYVCGSLYQLIVEASKYINAK